MIRLGKLTDYGLVLMTCIARNHERSLHTARDLARESRLPLPTVSKLLKELLQSGLLISHRGMKGGYSLAKEPHDISVAELLSVPSHLRSAAPTFPGYVTWSGIVLSRAISGSSAKWCEGLWKR